MGWWLEAEAGAIVPNAYGYAHVRGQGASAGTASGLHWPKYDKQVLKDV